MKNRGVKIIILDFDDIKNPLLSGGQARATLEVGSRLSRLGYKIEVLCSKYPGYKDRSENGISYKHIGISTKYIKLNNIIYILSLPFVISRVKAHIILECFTPPFSALFTPLWTRIPVVAIPSSFDAERFSKLYHLPFYIIERIGCRLYKYFLPYDKHLDKKMKTFNSSVVSKIVPEGVGDEYLRINPRNPKHILFIGRFDINQKGLDLLLEAYTRFSYKEKWPLIIAGVGPDRKKILALIKNLGLTKYVRLFGPMHGAKKRKIMSESLFVVFPSRSEGFSLFSLEAIAAGLPLVCFDIKSLSWADSAISFKAPAYNINKYAQQLNQASDIRVVNKMRKSCKEVAKSYSWDRVVREYDSFLSLVTQKEKKTSNFLNEINNDGCHPFFSERVKRLGSTIRL